MSPFSVIRFVPHTIRSHPDIPTVYSAACRSCGWSVAARPDQEAVDTACMAHAGDSNHRQFQRFSAGRAFVVREGEDDVSST
ncbi:DUF7848 domain-containing protein [Streptomyces sp. NBC_01224]|uniref:DUF7848 domain-containing protein n=1 Tax=Streptomyces sp. NBC_01224 TaxID=2903783 RepID=UPI003FA34FF2